MHPIISALSGVLLVVACGGRTQGDEDPVPAEVRAYARKRCQRLAACECRSRSYDSLEGCEDGLIALYTDEIVGSEGVNLTCFAEAAQLWDHSDCDQPYLEDPCNPVAQTQDIGGSCHFNLFQDMFLVEDSCQEGLFCLNERCTAPVVGIEEGMACSPEGLCGPDLTCFSDRCERHRSEGESCQSNTNCAPIQDLYCGNGVCTVKKAEEQDCTATFECGGPLVCTEGRCSEVSPFVCFFAEP